MPMVSSLVGRAVRDGTGRRGRLVDLTSDLHQAEHPAVRALVVDFEGARAAVPWSAGVDIGSTIRIADPRPPEPAAEDADAYPIHLAGDLMDALVLVLPSERVVRVNDIWLRHDGDRLLLQGIDVSPWAVIRRLARGWLGSGNERQIVDWRDVEYLRGDPASARPDLPRYRRRHTLPAASIARMAEALPYPHAAELVATLEDQRAADVFELLSPARQLQVFGELTDERACALFEAMSPDRVTDVLGRLDRTDAENVLGRLDTSRVELLTALLAYPADTAGGIMTNEVVTISDDLTVQQAIDAIRPRLQRPDFVYFVYVLASEPPGRLVGVLTLRDLLIESPDRPITQVMNRRLIVAQPMERARDVAYRLADHDLNALPVVDGDGRLLGVVTIDAAVAQIAPEAVRQDLPRVFA